MNQGLRACFTLGLILTGGLTKLCQGASTHPVETNPAITIHVCNYADVSPKTLIRGKDRGGSHPPSRSRNPMAQ